MKRPKAFLLVLVLVAFILPNCKKSDSSLQSEATASKSLTKRSVDLELVTGNLSSPIGLVAFPDNSGRLAVIDQTGKIRIISSAGTLMPDPYLDITSKMVTLSPGYDERGLLGLAFHPDYSSNGRFFIYYNAPRRSGGPAPGVNWNNLSVIAEYHVSAANANMADPDSERRLLEIDDPQSNHNGGTIAFDRAGYLYIAIGDGGVY